MWSEGRHVHSRRVCDVVSPLHDKVCVLHTRHAAAITVTWADLTGCYCALHCAMQLTSLPPYQETGAVWMFSALPAEDGLQTEGAMLLREWLGAWA